jgi:hypothetical protein
MTTRVNYTAKNFGFVGWEVFPKPDCIVMKECITIARSQMERMIGEKIDVRCIEL